MRRSKKFVIAAVLMAVLVFGSIGVIALADDNGDDSQPGAFFGALWDKVSAIYEQKTGDTLDQEALKEALAQAQSEMRDEAIQKLADEGKITQEQADEYLNWQKAAPDMEQFRQQLREWREAAPDMPFGFGFRGHGGFRGMGGMCGFGGPCAPVE